MKTEQNIPQANEEMEARLWAYIDGMSEEKSLIAKLVAERAEWRDKYAELLAMHQLIGALEVEQPSMRFTKNVMEEIARLQIAPAAKEYINKKIVWGIGVFFLTMIVGFLAYGIAQIDWRVTAGSADSSTGIDLTSVDYLKIFNNSFFNVVMMLNIVLGLFVLDRYLAAKRKKLMKF